MDSQKNTESPDIGANTSIEDLINSKIEKINKTTGYTLDITALNKIFSSDDILSLLYIVETELPYNAKLNPIHRRIKIAKQIRNKIYSLLKTNPEYSKIDKDTINDVLHQFFNDNKEFSPIFDYPPIISNDVLFSKIKKINCDTGYTIDIADLKNAFSNSDIFFFLNDIHIILLLNNEHAFSNKKKLNKKIIYDQIKVFILMELETNPKYFNKNQDKINTAINAFLVKLSQSMIDLDMTIDNR